MAIVRLDFAYDGTGFRGYAKQPGQRTVQATLEAAISQILSVDIRSSVAGRTDAGVHARQQVVSFQAADVDPPRLQRSLNSMLGGEIVVHDCRFEGSEFDARFSARGRAYRYVASAAKLPDPLQRNHVWHFGTSVDLDLLNETARQFVGEIDFTSFCRSVEGKSNVRRVSRSEWEWVDDDSLTYWVKANAFCHQMVRSLVGLCYDVARHHIPLDEVPQIIARAHRSTMGTVAPPHGLTLWEVSYGAEAGNH